MPDDPPIPSSSPSLRNSSLFALTYNILRLITLSG
jgi:hypothetical protein